MSQSWTFMPTQKAEQPQCGSFILSFSLNRQNDAVLPKPYSYPEVF